MTAIKWLSARWRWRRARHGRAWALNRAYRTHYQTTGDHKVVVIDALGGTRLIHRDPACYAAESTVLAIADQARSTGEFITALLPLYRVLNLELKEHPQFEHLFAFREEVGWLLHEADPRLGHPGARGPLAY